MQYSKHTPSLTAQLGALGYGHLAIRSAAMYCVGPKNHHRYTKNDSIYLLETEALRPLNLNLNLNLNLKRICGQHHKPINQSPYSTSAALCV